MSTNNDPYRVPKAAPTSSRPTPPPSPPSAPPATPARRSAANAPRTQAQGEPRREEPKVAGRTEVTPPTDPAVPAPATPEQELEMLLARDTTKLGDVFRLHIQKGMPIPEVAKELDVVTEGFIYSYRQTINAILEGRYPTAAISVRETRDSIAALLRSDISGLSKEAETILNQRLDDLNHLLSQAQPNTSEAAHQTPAIPQKLSPPQQELKVPTEPVDKKIHKLDGKEGIYAFSYGWYLESPMNPDLGTTLIKVGHATDLGQQIRDQEETTASHLPEPLVVVRAYTTDPGQAKATETHFRRLLETAGHTNPRRLPHRRDQVDKEWFVTSTDFLDAVAMALGLRIEIAEETTTRN